MSRNGRADNGVTLKDVAAHAGVSFSTVSHVINNRFSDVGPKTRERVHASIRALNYRPNIAARRLRKARTGVLALTIPEVANPYFSTMIGSMSAQPRHRAGACWSILRAANARKSSWWSEA